MKRLLVGGAMSSFFRIHGDNIVECERILNLITDRISVERANSVLVSPSVISWDLEFHHNNNLVQWHIELLPGFNKSGRSRWQNDIFDTLRQAGSILDETPDAIITRVEDDKETILCAIEFCSALQAGNQAWQRSGRAYSTGLAGCPYLYIVDFVKYELDPVTRERKILRFPNPVVPYSYISYAHNLQTFIAQAYVKSEEFDKQRDELLSSFDEDNFAEEDIKDYLKQTLLGEDTTAIENSILSKNENVVLFLAGNSENGSNFTEAEWRELCSSKKDIVSFSCEKNRFKFHKTITAKGHHGKSKQVQDITDRYSVGLASESLPFGIIPQKNRMRFGQELMALYPDLSEQIFSWIQTKETDLVVCMLKGFKPKGDDNRPDRGLLPLIRMLSSRDIDVLTFVYGPVLNKNLKLLQSDPELLCNNNGLWKSIIKLTDYLLLDVPVLNNNKQKDAELLTSFDSDRELFNAVLDVFPHTLTGSYFPSKVTEYHEDDVDTAIHFLFASRLKDYTFEGMCNPPGGDWSGFSIKKDDIEYRWLSLPRVSDDIDGKRPDHIVEFFSVFEKPLILAIESKEKPEDLEADVGFKLLNYMNVLMGFVPNVMRQQDSTWTRCTTKINHSEFEYLSAAAYLDISRRTDSEIYNNCKCDMLLVLYPIERETKWKLRIKPFSNKASEFKSRLMEMISNQQDFPFEII